MASLEEARKEMNYPLVRVSASSRPHARALRVKAAHAPSVGSYCIEWRVRSCQRGRRMLTAADTFVELHLQQHTDMKEEMRTEAIEVIVSSVEKFAGKYDLAVSPSR